MGYTNKTSHYELPQYVANDKPSWLGDFNAAMLKIDTVMADNDATAEAANSAATGAQTQVAALSSQLSTIQGQVNTAVDTATTADGKATTAQNVATQASTTAGEAKTLAEAAKQSADLALPISGGTMTGPLLLSGAPTADNGAATKAYVDANAGGSVTAVNYTAPNDSAGNALTVKGALCLTGKHLTGSLIVTGSAKPANATVGQLYNMVEFPAISGMPVITKTTCGTGVATDSSATNVHEVQYSNNQGTVQMGFTQAKLINGAFRAVMNIDCIIPG